MRIGITVIFSSIVTNSSTILNKIFLGVLISQVLVGLNKEAICYQHQAFKTQVFRHNIIRHMFVHNPLMHAYR
jgi:hypothetical protein